MSTLLDSSSAITLLKRVKNRVRAEISDIPIFQWRSDLIYQGLLESYSTHLPRLSPLDYRITQALKEEGIYITSLDEMVLPLSKDLLEGACSLGSDISTISTYRKNEYFIKASTQQLVQYPALFRWGLNERLLNIVENYLAMPAAYHGVYLRRDLANGVQRRTRLWHLDQEDRHMVKIIIYLNDVDDGGGSFQYIPKCLTQKIAQTLNYRRGVIKDVDMKAVVPPSVWKSCVGCRGMLIMLDPVAIFHRGQVPIDRDRFTLFFDYTSRYPKRPYYCKSPFSLDELNFLCEGTSAKQRSCVFWNDRYLN